jgi:hypothetical protein
MHLNAQRIRHHDRVAVHGAAIAEQDDIGDRPIDQQIFQKIRPVLRMLAVIYGAWKWPKKPIAAVEVNAADSMPGMLQRRSEPTEKRPGQPLEE